MRKVYNLLLSIHNVNKMDTIKLYGYLILCIFLFLYIGCFRPPSETDNKRLNLLKNKYGDIFQFKLVDDLYLQVSLKKERERNENDLIEVYKLFFFESDENNRRRDTNFVYLNYYDFKGKFQYQLSYDMQTKKYVKEKTEFY